MIAGLNAQVLSFNPLVVVVDDFASANECATFIRLAEGRLRRAIVGGRSGQAEVSDRRTGSDSLLRPDKRPELMPVLMKLGMAMRMPVEHAEGFNVLHYAPGQEFKPHDDAISAAVIARDEEKFRIAGGQRLYSTMIYLNNVAEGGATVFPKIGVKVEPTPGRLLMFAVTVPGSAEPDPQAIHAGEPVIEGEKWAAIAWWRLSPHEPVAYKVDDSR